MRTVVAFMSVAAATEGNPIAKVIELLGSLQQKVMHEGELEQRQYEAFVDWCQTSAKQKQWEIANGVSKVESLQGTIEKADADIETTSSKIDDLASSVTENEADLAKAKEVRKNEHEEFMAQDKSLAETIDTVERAISTLKRQAAAGFMQVSRGSASGLTDALQALLDASVFTSHEKNSLEAFMQSQAEHAAAAEDQDMETELAEAKARRTEDPSKAVTQILEDMLDKAEDRRATALKEEKESKHNFEMVEQSLQDEIKRDNREMKSEKKALAAYKETKATAEGDLALTDKDHGADVEGLHELQSDCMQKASDHEASVRGRQDELKALDDARNIIKEKAGGGASQAYSLSQTTADVPFQHVVTLLRQLGRKNGDLSVSLLASQVATAAGEAGGADPFKKVKGLIEKMIARLLDQAKAEAGHKAYCDKELGETDSKKAEHEDDIERLDSKLRKTTALIAQLEGEIADLQQELAAVAKSQKEMDTNRRAEHEDFKQAKTDYEQGVEAVQAAIQVLRNYYGKAFVQAPEVSTHSAAGGASTGIIGLLEVAESDFSKNLAEVEADEREAEIVYKRQTNENKILTATKKTEVKYKHKELSQSEQAVSELRQDREGEQTELDAVLEYLSKLNKMCVAKPDSYQERKARREQEIEGLKNALEILDGEGMAFVQVKKHQ